MLSFALRRSGVQVPLPMPLQNDPVDGGVRVAVIGQAAGTLQSLGELFFIVTSPDDGPGVTVEVSKRGGVERERGWHAAWRAACRSA
jgi:hypothetical protein